LTIAGAHLVFDFREAQQRLAAYQGIHASHNGPSGGGRVELLARWSAFNCNL
jgi:hypothetical protein